VQKKTRTNRDFFGCEDYPNCTWASWKKPQPVDSSEKVVDSGGSGEDESETEE